MKDVPQGDPLNAQALKLEQWPKDKVPAGALDRWRTSRAAARGPSSTRTSRSWRTSSGRQGRRAPGADILIPKGYRVVSIRVDAVSGGANLILPGCRVDLLVHLAKNVGRGIHETTTRTILQDIKVFAVNDVVTIETGGAGNEVDPGAGRFRCWSRPPRPRR